MEPHPDGAGLEMILLFPYDCDVTQMDLCEKL